LQTKSACFIGLKEVTTNQVSVRTISSGEVQAFALDSDIHSWISKGSSSS
jgi:hypothetical protein